MGYISVFKKGGHEETTILLGVPVGLLAYPGYIVVFMLKNKLIDEDQKKKS
jgi:hypothetical protein